MAKTIKEKIEVMQHFADGGEVECEDTGYGNWGRANSPCWNWKVYNYRIKEQKVIIEKWLIEENDIKFVVETSDIGSWLKPFATSKKLKLIESYEVEI